MKVKFANAEVDVWKLRQGVVLGCGSEFVHVVSFSVYEDHQVIRVEFHDGVQVKYNSCLLEWLEPY